MLCVKSADETRLSEHFVAKEFACKCCGMVLVHPELIRKLEALRFALGAKPVIIISGYRCADHNKAVGGDEKSYHMFGMAADIFVSGVTTKSLVAKAESAGFDGIGIYVEKAFIHVDVRGYPSKWEG